MVSNLVPETFIKNENYAYPGPTVSEKCYSLFLLYAQVELYQNILTLRCSPFDSTLHKAFLKKAKRGLELASRLILCMIFEEEYFTRYILSADQN